MNGRYRRRRRRALGEHGLQVDARRRARAGRRARRASPNTSVGEPLPSISPKARRCRPGGARCGSRATRTAGRRPRSGGHGTGAARPPAAAGVQLQAEAQRRGRRRRRSPGSPGSTGLLQVVGAAGTAAARAAACRRRRRRGARPSASTTSSGAVPGARQHLADAEQEPAPDSVIVSTGSAVSIVTRRCDGRCAAERVHRQPGEEVRRRRFQLRLAPASSSRTTLVTGAAKADRQAAGRRRARCPCGPWRVRASAGRARDAARRSPAPASSSAIGPSANAAGSVVPRGTVWKPCRRSSTSRRRKRPVIR